MKKTIYCPDITCESCVKVLTRAFDNVDGVKNFQIKKDHVLVDYNDKKIQPSALLEAIREKGYRAGFTPFSRKTFRERTRDFLSNKKKYEVEYSMLRYTFLSFFFLVLLEILGYYTFFKQNPGFLTQYGWWIFYTDVMVVSVAAAIWHFKSYRVEIPHMTGMMIGMTSGLMIGTIIAVTNGLFVGALTGMILSSLVGWYTGKCCGVMGVLEGLMAGVMGAMMGSMIGVMLISEHILIFMPVFMILMLTVLGGLSYMLFEEVVEDKEAIERMPVDFWTFFSYCFLATFLLILIMLYGWKSAIVMVM